MFKFLFGRTSKKPEVIVRETQRETVMRTVRELNEILPGLSPRASIGVDLQHGTLSIALPEQMPDEAKALPAPEPKPEPEPETPKTPDALDTADTATKPDTPAKADKP
ncbi:hypothetical protein [Roseinatronobacter sp. S2]|uniref:hypothetical protein n=1 Tax=Roseinatronobacter sp. S2 TaxID=3035471 RepID=UPI00240FB067|nr:hypothetical protein [Roseinatronobacter sp. S2]WFE73474.1 hypothetical protein P8S53_09755 [Roseinatronobacter sp. S2]